MYSPPPTASTRRGSWLHPTRRTKAMHDRRLDQSTRSPPQTICRCSSPYHSSFSRLAHPHVPATITPLPDLPAHHYHWSQQCGHDYKAYLCFATNPTLSPLPHSGIQANHRTEPHRTSSFPTRPEPGRVLREATSFRERIYNIVKAYETPPRPWTP